MTKNEQIDICPVCGEKANGWCKCLLGEKFCPNGHAWFRCPEHPDKIVFGNSAKNDNTHKGDTLRCHCRDFAESVGGK